MNPENQNADMIRRFEEMMTLLSRHGADPAIAEYFAPVLRGEQTLEQNREMLLEMLARAEE